MPTTLWQFLVDANLTVLLERDFRQVAGTIGLVGPLLHVEREVMFQCHVDQQADQPYLKLSDHFVFVAGESANRCVTKVGGPPYRDKTRPWPLSRDDKPLVFVGQFCFSQSLDIVPRLPAEVLLVFGTPLDHSVLDLQFEWQSLISDDRLVPETDIPAHDFPLPRCYGVPFRTYELPWYVMADRSRDSLFIASPLCTKIGGYPYGYQQNERYPDYLCSLGPILFSRLEEYPWLNCAEPLDERPEVEGRELMWGDCFGAHLSLLPDGRVTWFDR
ncbi:MAG: DUF1963 domain-containing protein [Pirellulales bacterium]|nr:DUF1963 domain-containing protein [Pirellulales bacterium]